MRFFDLLHMAFMNLWRRKLRAALTVLGMVIGTASIVVMISLGIGNSKAMEEMFASWGDLTTITVNAYGSGMGGRGGGSEMTLDKRAAEGFAAMPGVKAVMPIINSWGMVKSGKYATDLQLAAIDMSQAEAFGLKLEQGRFAHSGGTLNNIEIVFSGYTLQNFYNPKNWQPAVDANGMPLVNLERSRFQMTFDYNNIYDNQYEDPGGEPVQRGKFYKLTPVGTMDQEGNNSWYSYIDINVFQKLARENKNFMGDIDINKYTEIWVKCQTTDTVLDTKAAIEEMGYGTYTLLEGLEMMQESARQTQLLLGGIGAISLLVAAIGIVNTMLMSIYERTREIGIIKVLGCRMNNIAALFLTEAAYIGFFGGLLGLGLSYGLSAILNTVLAGSDIGMGYGASAMSVIPAYLALFALVFSVVVALVSGLYPALRAMRLSALAAIRNE